MCGTNDTVELPNWQNVPHITQDKEACIAASVEWALRYLLPQTGKIPIKDIEADLFAFMGTERNFVKAEEFLHNEFPDIVADRVPFDKNSAGAEDKIGKIRSAIQNGGVPLVSIAQRPKGPWHVVPVVKVDGDEIYVKDPHPNGPPSYQISKVQDLHVDWEGGEDLLILGRKS